MAYNPEFLLLIVAEYLRLISNEPLHPSEAPSPSLTRVTSILDHLASTVPGMLEVQLLLARCKLLTHDHESVEKALCVDDISLRFFFFFFPKLILFFDQKVAGVTVSLKCYLAFC